MTDDVMNHYLILKRLVASLKLCRIYAIVENYNKVKAVSGDRWENRRHSNVRQTNVIALLLLFFPNLRSLLDGTKFDPVKWWQGNKMSETRRLSSL